MTDPETPQTPPETNGVEAARVAPRSPRSLIQPEQPPEPPPRSAQAKRPWIAGLNGFFSFILFCALMAFAGIYFIKTRLVADGPLTADMTLVVPARSNMTDVAKLLHNQGIISDPLTFQAGVVINQARGRLKAGEYFFPARVSMEQVIGILREGKSILHAVTIPEGLTSQMIVQRLVNYDFLSGQIERVPPEGTLLPDTYNVQRGTSRQKILDQMAEAQKKLIAGLMAKKAADAFIKTPEELLTLASIIEKETGKAEERPRVASVFLNRLKRGMKLQSDPTIIYGIAGGKGTLDRPLTREDLLRPTPYNTYVIEKLPPTPIANPGRLAIEAVINPATSNDLYFVADGTGGHAFAPSLDEHNKNVAKWRQIQRARGEAPQPESTTPPPPPTPAPVTPDDTKPQIPDKPAQEQPSISPSGALPEKLDLRLTPGN
jgi:UPF0755 protein